MGRISGNGVVHIAPAGSLVSLCKRQCTRESSYPERYVRGMTCAYHLVSMGEGTTHVCGRCEGALAKREEQEASPCSYS